MAELAFSILPDAGLPGRSGRITHNDTKLSGILEGYSQNHLVSERRVFFEISTI